jgi:hypothetical protein
LVGAVVKEQSTKDRDITAPGLPNPASKAETKPIALRDSPENVPCTAAFMRTQKTQKKNKNKKGGRIISLKGIK